MASPKIKISDGNSIPLLGLGTSSLVGSEPGQPGYEAIKSAIVAGYRHIDTAFLYRTENIVGRAVNRCIEEGLIRREDITIVTKVWCTSHKRSSVMESAKNSCKALGLEYVDLLLIHWPMAYEEDGDPINPKDSNGKLRYSETDYIETWQGMEDVKEAGLAKSIGLSNFNHEMINRILTMCRHRPTVNQVECHPYLNQRKLLDFCTEKNIVLTAYCPLGMPHRSDAKKDDPELLADSTVNRLAEKYHKSPAQILIRYQIQRNVIVIPKSVNESRIKANIDVFDFGISSEDMCELENLNKNFRFCLNVAGEYPTDHRYFPLHLEF